MVAAFAGVCGQHLSTSWGGLQHENEWSRPARRE